MKICTKMRHQKNDEIAQKLANKKRIKISFEIIDS